MYSEDLHQQQTWTYTHRDPRTASTYSDTHTQTETHIHTDIDTHTERPTHYLNSLDLTLHTAHLTDNSHSDFLRDEKCFRATRRLVSMGGAGSTARSAAPGLRGVERTARNLGSCFWERGAQGGRTSGSASGSTSDWTSRVKGEGGSSTTSEWTVGLNAESQGVRGIYAPAFCQGGGSGSRRQVMQFFWRGGGRLDFGFGFARRVL